MSHLKVSLYERMARAREVAWRLCQLHSEPQELYEMVRKAIKKAYPQDAYKKLAPETFAAALVRRKWREVPGKKVCPFLPYFCEVAGVSKDSVQRVLGRMG